MNLALAAAVFPVIFLGELPDKTMFASLLLSTKGRPAAVWCGAAAAFVIHVVIATTIGVALFHLLPHRVVDAVVAGIFFLGAVFAFREMRHDGEHAGIIAHEVASRRRVVTTAFGVIFLAEWGDITQLLIANLAAHYHQPLSVGIGSLLALWVVAALAVISGQGLLRFVNVRTLRLVTGVAMLGLAGFAAWQAFR